ncbi:hypothetical protein R3P38DRAFT_3206257 [Favolaschia claudopus]|uniref:Uncharacterized protein n=1 Tax=Favolaschia claudopus TaxID=2862362 RepID=A0AAW0AKG7_9AGAR
MPRQSPRVKQESEGSDGSGDEGNAGQYQSPHSAGPSQPSTHGGNRARDSGMGNSSNNRQYVSGFPGMHSGGTQPVQPQRQQSLPPPYTPTAQYPQSPPTLPTFNQLIERINQPTPPSLRGSMAPPQYVPAHAQRPPAQANRSGYPVPNPGYQPYAGDTPYIPPDFNDRNAQAAARYNALSRGRGGGPGGRR